MDCSYYFVPIVPTYSGGYPNVVLEGAMEDDRLIPLGKLGPLSDILTRYASKGGVVTDGNVRGGNIIQQRDGSFAMTTTPQAQRKIECATTGLLALELDADGTVKDCFLADRPFAYAKMEKAAERRFQKRLETERRPMTLEQALRKALSEPLGYNDFGGGLRKDIATTRMPQSNDVDQTFRPQPKRPSQTPPAGTIDVGELARGKEQIRICIQHLGAAQRVRPGDRSIAEAGNLAVSLDGVIGLGIDSRFLEGGFSVAVSPDGRSTDLTDALERVQQKSADVRAADKFGGDLLFSKAYSACRQPVVMNRSEQLGYGQVFTKAASKSTDVRDGEADQILRRHSAAQAHLKILGDKIQAAVTANPDSMAAPHLRAAAAAHREATKHVNSCLN
jgi:hypothetical protein